MFRFLFAAFALMFMASLFFGPEGAAVGVGLAVLAPFLFFAKFMFFMLMFGFFFRMMSGGPRRWASRDWGSEWQRPAWHRPSGSRTRSARHDHEDEATRRERFEELHDLAHARKEVDSWGTYDL